MKIVIHRGTHQIGGIATEISTESTRIIIDMGEELSVDPDFVPEKLQISGVTDNNGKCDAVLFTHYHGDHIGQMKHVRREIPLYAGPLAKDIMLMSAEHSYKKDDELCSRIKTVMTFDAGVPFFIGDIKITPYSIDHSACDSYMFLLESGGKRILYTGDFRMHGIRGKAIPKILDKLVHKVDVVITEGTTLSRKDSKPETEHELQQRVKEYMTQYKYVFVLCASTNLDRVFAFARAVARGKYCICDEYQETLLKQVTKHWSGLSPFYAFPKICKYKDDLLPGLQKRGFLMFVRANRKFENIISKFDPSQSIILYSMWDGYRTKQGSNIPDFLSLAGTWEALHTSGHASADDIKMLIEKTNPEVVVTIHTEAPERLKDLCPGRKVVLLSDGEEFFI